MLALSMLLACAPRHAPPVAASTAPADEAQREEDLREACEAGQVPACLELAVLLEVDQGRSRQALDLLMPHLDHEFAVAGAAVLLVGAHPEMVSVDERRQAWRALCFKQGFTAGCAVGGLDLASADPELADELWRLGCQQDAPWLCPPARPGAQPAVELPPEFRAQLEAVDARFDMPVGFHAIPVEESHDFQTSFAILSEDGSLEIRYAVRDDSEILGLTEQCREQPGCVSASMQNIEQSMAAVTLANVGHVPPDQVALGPFPALPVRLEFNAHWGLVGTVRANPDFSPDQPITTLGLVHRDPAANLYIFWIAHDPERSQVWQAAALRALRFASSPGLGGTWL